jgi:hypothetical protein
MMADFKVGCILIALGAKAYGRMAFNCALSIKGQYKKDSPQLPVWLFYDDSAVADLSPKHTAYFDRMIPMPKECYVSNDKVVYFKSKLYLHELSPFEHTFWLDSDSLLIHNGIFPQIVERLVKPTVTDSEGNRIPADSIIYQPMVYNSYDVATMKLTVPDKPAYGVWSRDGRVESVVNRYGLQQTKIPQTNSSFVYFKKEGSKPLFDEMIRLYDEPNQNYHDFRNEAPDEYYFNIASARTGIQPATVPFVPFYDAKYDPYSYATSKLSYRDYIVSRYMGITMMGERSNQQDIDVYNDLLNYFHGYHQFNFPQFQYSNFSKYGKSTRTLAGRV